MQAAVGRGAGGGTQVLPETPQPGEVHPTAQGAAGHRGRAGASGEGPPPAGNSVGDERGLWCALLTLSPPCPGHECRFLVGCPAVRLS